MGLNEQTVAGHAKNMALAPEFMIYETKLNHSHLGKVGPHLQIVDGFLNHVSDTYALECLTGRGGQDVHSVLYLPSDLNRTQVFEDYICKYSELFEDAIEALNCEVSNKPLSFSAFLEFWDKDHPSLRVSKPRSYFCDFCTSVRNNLHNLPTSDPRHSFLSQLLEIHREAERREQGYYREGITSSHGIRDGTLLHIVFDFSEKVLLPRLVRQPGQLYFVTALKFDIFGVHDSKNVVTFTYGLP